MKAVAASLSAPDFSSTAFGDSLGCVLEPTEIQPAPAGSGVEILRQQQFFAAVDEHRR